MSTHLSDLLIKLIYRSIEIGLRLLSRIVDLSLGVLNSLVCLCANVFAGDLGFLLGLLLRAWKLVLYLVRELGGVGWEGELARKLVRIIHARTCELAYLRLVFERPEDHHRPCRSSNRRQRRG